MAELEYRDTNELPAHLRAVFLDPNAQRWRVAALVIHRDRDTGRETGRVAFLRRADPGGGTEWEISVDELYETAEVEL
ncbi:hypothetical protein [Streptomyces sp. CB03238]|uniref:hypothetical protein n=1 Tax=Streptomyces sp. CB03238 TaxID=1907777 RepID=UPI000A110C0A|nr:hypothetical protein [Streptomyces sp. CB03238]ORT53484.1 hypothetical protein BKD26_38275 [Streptomyces sp. CB03238]